MDLQENFMNATVPLLTEIPETLQESMNNYLETHPDWDQNRVLTAALSLFLLQNGESDRQAARIYLETLFHH
jgi:predicted TPR repeat methyltransferase